MSPLLIGNQTKNKFSFNYKPFPVKQNPYDYCRADSFRVRRTTYVDFLSRIRAAGKHSGSFPANRYSNGKGAFRVRRKV